MASTTLPTGRRIGGAALLLILCLAAFSLLRSGLAARATDHRQLGLALAAAPTDPDALRMAGEGALGAKQFDLARRRAAAALVRAPLDRRALRTLGLATDALGDPVGAAKVLNKAAQLSWRDPATQLWLLRAALLANDPTAAMQRADALLRGRNQEQPLFALLRQLALTDVGRGVLAQHLADRPQWRPWFLGTLSAASPREAAAAIALIDTMRKTQAPPAEADAAPLLRKLVDAGYGADAADLWARVAGARPSADGNRIEDPDFRGASPADDSDAPFRWTWRSDAEVGVELGSDPHGAPALVVEDSGSGATAFVSRAVALAPGRYRLSFDASAPGANDALTRLSARLQCWSSGTDLVRLSAAPAARTAEAGIFTVPADCSAQRLSFSVASRDLGTNATFYIRRVRLVPA